ncbi:MAG: iron chaperone [Nitrososphaerales archaeon]
MSKQPETIDEYIASFPKNVQSILQKMRQTIQKAAPEAEETISYQIPTFKLNGNLVHFAAFKDHISFFPTSSARGAFKKELSKYKGGKGTVQFPMGEQVPYDLMKKIVIFRRKQNLRAHDSHS